MLGTDGYNIGNIAAASGYIVDLLAACLVKALFL